MCYDCCSGVQFKTGAKPPQGGPADNKDKGNDVLSSTLGAGKKTS